MATKSIETKNFFKEIYVDWLRDYYPKTYTFVITYIKNRIS